MDKDIKFWLMMLVAINAFSLMRFYLLSAKILDKLEPTRGGFVHFSDGVSIICWGIFGLITILLSVKD